MNIGKALNKFVVGSGINALIGEKVVGIGALLVSNDLGGYLDPNRIDGFTYNPQDGRWYEAPPAPDYGWYQWSNPASPEQQLVLDKLREAYIKDNQVERRTPLPEYSISDRLWQLFEAAKNFVLRRDPLALDLDGDGIETVGVGATPVLFDHDGDGVRTGTGWVKGDDAFLALDRNGNGTIDNGGELFGVDTVLANGQKATDGFAALADLDSNRDGVFNSADSHYANVRIWCDLNQNGISQANELSTLASAGIASIHLTSTAAATNLGNGNLLTAVGTYTKTNGQTGSVGEFTTGSTGNLDLAQNPFYSDFTDPVPLTDGAKTLPGMQGSGMVRDLQQAASIDGALVADVSNDNFWRMKA